MTAKATKSTQTAEMPTVEGQGIFHYSTVVNDFEKDKGINLL
jgi:hypothetical protein